MDNTAQSEVCLAEQPQAKRVSQRRTVHVPQRARPWSAAKVPPDRLGSDAEVEHAEAIFQARLATAWREDQCAPEDPDDWRCHGAAEELRRRWWRRPILYSQLAQRPQDLLSLPEAWGREEDVTVNPDDLASSADDSIQPTLRADRQRTLEIAGHRLSLPKLRCICFDFDVHGDDRGNVHLAPAIDRFLGAQSLKFTSKSGRGLHCYFALAEPLDVAAFVDWAKAWGFNRRGDIECFTTRIHARRGLV